MNAVEDVKSRVLAVLEELPEGRTGLSIPEIYYHLNGEYSQPVVRKAVMELQQAGRLEQARNPIWRGHIYYLKERVPAQGVLWTQTREEVERESRSLMDLWEADEEDREDASVSVMQAIAYNQAAEEHYAQAVKSVATEIANADPAEVILQAAEWFISDYNNLATEIRLAFENGDMSAVRRKSQELGFRRAKAEALFRRLLRLDDDLHYQRQIVDPGILLIPSVEACVSRGGRAVLDCDRAATRIRERIQGDRWIEICTVPENHHQGAVGSDASLADIVVPHRAGSFIPPTPANLFVAAGSLRVRGVEQRGYGYTDYDIDPRKLDEYEDLRAAEEGLIISPQVRREVISDFRHLRSAMMELRQYTEELRIVDERADWHPTGDIPTLDLPPHIGILFRDGRIFPLVHRLTDYDGASAPDDVLYGEVVRREIGRFQGVFQKTAGMGSYSGTLYAGVTKAPEFSWLAMLTFWYIAAHNGQSFESFYRPPLNDQAVAHLLFWGLAENDPTLTKDRKAFVTFRVMRRFSDIAFERHPLLLEPPGATPRALNEDADDDWNLFIRQHISDAEERYRMHKRGVPPLESPEHYGPFLYLCRHAAVGMFYGLPTHTYQATLESRSHLFSPRWEIGIDIDVARKMLPRGLESLLSWITEPDGLRRDEDHTMGGYPEPQVGLPLMIPDVVRYAHEAVVWSQGRHGRDVQSRLQELFNAVRETLGKRER